MRPIAIAVLLFQISLLLACSSTGTSKGPNLYEKYFSESEMEKSLSRKNENLNNISIIEWRIIEDNRPLYVCEVLGKAKCGDKRCLFRAFKHPKKPDPLNGWNFSIVYDGNRSFLREYDREIVDKDIYDFTKASGWNDVRTEFRLIDSGHREKWWQFWK